MIRQTTRRDTYTTDVASYNRRSTPTERRGYKEEWRENMCFCETNRIGFMMKTRDNVLRWNWMRSKRVGIPIRFVWDRNEASEGSRDGNVPPTFRRARTDGWASRPYLRRRLVFLA